MRLFFQKKISEASQIKEQLEKEFYEAKERMNDIGRDLHKKKSITTKTALELVLDGLKSGTLKKEDL